MQSKKHSRIESVTNAIVGIIMSILIQLMLYPLMGIPVTINQNLIITMIFFLASYFRSYVIRRLFNKITTKWNNKNTD